MGRAQLRAGMWHVACGMWHVDSGMSHVDCSLVARAKLLHFPIGSNEHFFFIL
jgi:hypothetical protein